uniref:Uncharacterized protein n=1 Tax=Sphaerodactylus townsendi TaxID=933632 RepID=A0ACB8F036_9SAUR
MLMKWTCSLGSEEMSKLQCMLGKSYVAICFCPTEGVEVAAALGVAIVGGRPRGNAKTCPEAPRSSLLLDPSSVQLSRRRCEEPGGGGSAERPRPGAGAWLVLNTPEPPAARKGPGQAAVRATLGGKQLAWPGRVQKAGAVGFPEERRLAVRSWRGCAAAASARRPGVQALEKAGCGDGAIPDSREQRHLA